MKDKQHVVFLNQVCSPSTDNVCS